MPGLNLNRDEAQIRSANLQIESYNVTLDVSKGRETFLSTSVVKFTATPGFDTFIDAAALRIISATLNGTILDVSNYDGESIFLKSLAAQNELTIESEVAYSKVGEGLQLSVDPVDDEVYLYSQGETAHIRKMYACFDQPDLKATFTFTAIAPSHWEVISNNPVAAKIENGDSTTWNFTTTPRISTYITALVAGPYAHVHDEYKGKDKTVPLGIYCRKSLIASLDPEEIFLITKQGFEYFENVFGLAYPFDKYDQIAVVDYNWGAMENAGCVTFRESGFVFRSKVTAVNYEWRANTILHEMAHMWFGNLVTMQWWDDLWLNESFAEWASHVALEEATSYKDAWTGFAIQRKGWAYNQDQMSTTHPIATDMFDIEMIVANFDGISYAKGASALRQLDAHVGRRNFILGLRAYFAEFAWKNTTLNDLLEALERNSDRDLGPWVDTWIKTAGANTLRPAFELDSDGNYLFLDIIQEPPKMPVGSEELRPHRLALALYDLQDEKLVLRQSQEFDIWNERTEIPEFKFDKQPDLLLLNADDLSYGKWRLDDRSVATLKKHLGTISESINRAACWSTVWDMLRDAELSATDWVEIALNGLPFETNVLSFTAVANQISTAIEHYAAPKNRAALGEKAASAIYAMLEKSAPGSDLQLQLARTFASLATTSSDTEKIRAIFKGKISGLSIDTELKWSLATALTERGAFSAAELDRLLTADNTIPGNASYRRALAAHPTLAAKQDAWDAAYSRETGTQTRQALMGGFMRHTQRELLKAFVNPYFDSLLTAWDQHGFEVGEDLTQAMFPVYIDTYEVLEKTDEWIIQNSSASAALLRYVTEGRDTLVRGLKAQAKDA